MKEFPGIQKGIQPTNVEASSHRSNWWSSPSTRPGIPGPPWRMECQPWADWILGPAAQSHKQDRLIHCMCLYTIYYHIDWSGERVWSPQCFCWLGCAQCVYSWTRTLLGGLWNVHNFCDTCTTSVKRAQLLGNVHSCWETRTTSLTRAQHLWNVHNISETCTTSLTRAQHLWNVHI